VTNSNVKKILNNSHDTSFSKILSRGECGVYSHNACTGEVEAGELKVQSHTRLHSGTLFQKTNWKIIRKKEKGETQQNKRLKSKNIILSLCPKALDYIHLILSFPISKKK
jgi:hypothetical protein